MCCQCSGVPWVSHNANTLEMIIHFSEVLVAKIDDNVSASLETLKLIPISEVSEMNAKNAEKFMSSKEQSAGQAPEEIIMDQHEEIEAVEPEASAEQVDPRDEKIANLEAQLAEAQTRERDGILRVKLKWKTCVDVLNWILKKPQIRAGEIHQRIAAGD